MAALIQRHAPMKLARCTQGSIPDLIGDIDQGCFVPGQYDGGMLF